MKMLGGQKVQKIYFKKNIRKNGISILIKKCFFIFLFAQAECLLLLVIIHINHFMMA